MHSAFWWFSLAQIAYLMDLVCYKLSKPWDETVHPRPFALLDPGTDLKDNCKFFPLTENRFLFYKQKKTCKAVEVTDPPADFMVGVSRTGVGSVAGADSEEVAVSFCVTFASRCVYT